MSYKFNSIYDNRELIKFFDDWDAYSQGNPFERGYMFEVEMYDDATGDSEVFTVWAEDEESLSEDIYYFTKDEEFYSMVTSYIKKIN